MELLRRAPVWRKPRMLEDTNQTVKDLLLAGLRERFPQDSPAVLRRRLAEHWPGKEISAAACGARQEHSPTEQLSPRLRRFLKSPVWSWRLWIPLGCATSSAVPWPAPFMARPEPPVT